MPTKEERREALAATIKEKEIKAAEFRATLPKRFKAISDSLEGTGIRESITLNDYGPVIFYYFPESSLRSYEMERTLTHHSEEYEIESVEKAIQELKDEHAAIRARMAIAAAAFNKLTHAEKKCVKEFIGLLR